VLDYTKITVIPNSERVYAISADQASLRSLDLNEISRVPASKNFEFGIAAKITIEWHLLYL
jgi:hypothetical protein